ncbi:MAG: TIGR04438 family Trp-rich protein [Paucibacter sp.]|nr:TIGR04438 family Trp-rich protein [Roseateles sp.]
MAFVVIGVLLVLLKYGEVGPVAAWSWLWVLSPFAAAVVWWAWSDSSGRTSRKAMERLADRKEKRREEALEKLGLDARHHNKK